MPKTVQQIGERLVELCKADDTRTGLLELYSRDAVSVEAAVMPGNDSAAVTGVEAIKGKHDWWEATFDVHSAGVDGPYPHGDDRFGVIFEIDATNKETRERMTSKEIAIYTVAGGKIVREEFFYTM